jgi:hypothetical protein
MKQVIFVLFFLVTKAGFGQTYILPNEELIYSFETKNGKVMVLAKDKANEYIIYRFGTKTKIEFEFPEKSKDSWSKFKYSFAFRGGGISNSGIDLNYVYFTNNNFQYVIYDTYFSEGEKYNIGVKIIDLNTNKIIDIKGLRKTQKGNLIAFRDNNLLEIGDDLFD